MYFTNYSGGRCSTNIHRLWVWSTYKCSYVWAAFIIFLDLRLLIVSSQLAKHITLYLLSPLFDYTTKPKQNPIPKKSHHYSDVIMGTMTSQITSLMIVYSTVYPGADQRKHQSSASLAFLRGIHRWPVNSPHTGPVTRKMFPFDDVIIPRLSIYNVIPLYQSISVLVMPHGTTGPLGPLKMIWGKGLQGINFSLIV